jgi:hypothetical protein
MNWTSQREPCLIKLVSSKLRALLIMTLFDWKADYLLEITQYYSIRKRHFVPKQNNVILTSVVIIFVKITPPRPILLSGNNTLT